MAMANSNIRNLNAIWGLGHADKLFPTRVHALVLPVNIKILNRCRHVVSKIVHQDLGVQGLGHVCSYFLSFVMSRTLGISAILGSKLVWQQRLPRALLYEDDTDSKLSSSSKLWPLVQLSSAVHFAFLDVLLAAPCINHSV